MAARDVRSFLAACKLYVQAGALANLIGTPIAIAIGGLAVAVFATGPATIHSKVRNLGATLREMETREPASVPSGHTYR